MFTKLKLSRLASKPFLLLAAAQLVILTAAILYALTGGADGHETHFQNEDYIYQADPLMPDSTAIDAGSGYSGSFIRTRALSLEKGIYRIQIDYTATGEGNQLSISTEQISPFAQQCTEINLDPMGHTAALTLELPQDAADLMLSVSFSGKGMLKVEGLSIKHTGSHSNRHLFYAVLICLLINVLYYFKKSDASTRTIFLALTGIFLVSCYPLYLDYLVVGHDIPFHLLRIEGIADGISSGVFPVKIHPLWARDYGYAVGTLYGDILLYFPALLRLSGFSVQAAYQLFIAAINLGTLVISYFCFKKMFHSRKTGLLGSAVYTLSFYRLSDVYTRGAVGECTAMMFLPVVLTGFYLIFSDSRKENWWKHGALTALGLTGLVQTHTLSCEMAAFCIILACLFLIRKIFRKYTLFALLCGAGMTVLFNLGFLVPFCEYYFFGDLHINSPDWSGNNGYFQQGGLFPVQLFSLFQNSNGGAWSTTAGVASEATYGLGIFFFFAIGLFIYLLAAHHAECRSSRNFKAACVCSALGCLLSAMTTCYFPWDAIAAWGSFAQTLIFSMQFPWRLLAFATVLLTFTACFSVSLLFQVHSRPSASLCTAGILLLMTVNIGAYMYDLVYTTTTYRVYDTSELNTMALYSYDYLPADTDPALLEGDLIRSKGEIDVEAFRKHGTSLSCRVTAYEDSTVDFPLIYYNHYVCQNLYNGEYLQVSAGYNNMVRVSFPAGYDGMITVSFREPWYWRLSEIVSLISGVGFLILLRLCSVQTRQAKKAG